MLKKSLKEKITDLFFGTVSFLILYFIIAFLLKSSWLKDNLSLPTIYELLKDGLSITAGLLAPAAALLLFSDWKEQHVLTLVDTAARKISEDIQDIYILTMQAFYNEPLEISDENIRLQEHTTKGSLFDLRRSIEINEKIITNSGIECNSLLFNIMCLRELSLDLENIIRMSKYSKNIIENNSNIMVI